jgi:hypothetical protein
MTTFEKTAISRIRNLARILFKIEHVFSIPGRGLVLTPGIKPEGGECFYAGNVIEIRKPDGALVRTTISSLELLCLNPNKTVVVLLPESFNKEDVPIGSEIWSVD